MDEVGVHEGNNCFAVKVPFFHVSKLTILFRDIFSNITNKSIVQYMERYKRTKRPMTAIALRLPRALRDLWHTAAEREEISQSEFFRKAIEERALRILTKADTDRGNAA